MRALLSLTFLIIASIYDIRTREVPNKLWVIFLPFSIIATIAYAVANPSQIYLILASISITVIMAVMIFYMGLYGGADSKALIMLALTHPTQLDGSLVLPFFPLSAFNNSLVLMILMLPLSLMRNLYWTFILKRPLFEGLEAERAWKKAATLLFCVKSSRSNVKPYHQLAEKIGTENGQTRKTLQIFQRVREEDAVEDESILGDVFVVYSLPMLPFLGLGYVLAMTVGDIILRLTATLLV